MFPILVQRIVKFTVRELTFNCCLIKYLKKSIANSVKEWQSQNNLIKVGLQQVTTQNLLALLL